MGIIFLVSVAIVVLAIIALFVPRYQQLRFLTSDCRLRRARDRSCALLPSRPASQLEAAFGHCLPVGQPGALILCD